MTKNAKDQAPQMIPLWNGELRIVASPNSGPASARWVKAMANKLGKLQQKIIEFADPAICRNLLPVVSADLNELKENPSIEQLRRISSMSAAMPIMMTNKKKGMGW